MNSQKIYEKSFANEWVGMWVFGDEIVVENSIGDRYSTRDPDAAEAALRELMSPLRKIYQATRAGGEPDNGKY